MQLPHEVESFAGQANPDWSRAEKVHDWRNYVGSKTRAVWATLSREQRIAIALDADELASREEWE